MGFPETKSEKEGPELSRSEKAVARRGSDLVVEGGGGLSTVVAKERFCGMRRGLLVSRKVEETMRRARREAIVEDV